LDELYRDTCVIKEEFFASENKEEFFALFFVGVGVLTFI